MSNVSSVVQCVYIGVCRMCVHIHNNCFFFITFRLVIGHLFVFWCLVVLVRGYYLSGSADVVVREHLVLQTLYPYIDETGLLRSPGNNIRSFDQTRLPR